MANTLMDEIRKRDAEIAALRVELGNAYERAARCALAYGSPAVTVEVARRIRALSAESEKGEG